MSWARIAVLAMAVFALGGCGSLGPTPSVALVCDAFSLGDGAVAGLVRITADGTWLEEDDGRQFEVVWPPEVEIRPDGLYGRDSGRLLVQNGERLRLIQTAWGSAAGTDADPYRPGWCSFYDRF